MRIGGREAAKAALSVVLMATLAITVVPTPVAGTTGTLTITTDTTLTEDHDGDIVIAADDITLDCAGNNVTGPGSGTGILLFGRTGVTVKNCHVRGFGYGLRIDYSTSNTLTGNHASSNTFYGIYLKYSSSSTLTDNHASSNAFGITLSASSSNVLTRNHAFSNTIGIQLFSSDNTTLTDNTASDNRHNFGVSGSDFSHYNQDIDGSNTVDGKSILYLIGAADTVFDAATNAGTIYLINGSNLTIRDLTLTRNVYGVFLWNAVDSRIENVTVSDNSFGIKLQSSSNNVLAGNHASLNGSGIHLRYSTNNTVSGNDVSSNRGLGIYLFRSTNNTITANDASSNERNGIYLISSTNNTVTGNDASSNSNYGIYLGFSNGNTFTANNVSANGDDGIYLHLSDSNTLTANNVSANGDDGIYLHLSDSNTMTGNNFSANGDDGVALLRSSMSNVLTENSVFSNGDYGIYLSSSDNTIHHNNFIENAIQAGVASPHQNTWSNASGGNYWSDYTGVDADGDGIGDTPYAIPEGNQDDDPLMCLWNAPPPHPVACFFFSPRNPVLGELITLDASASYDPDGSIVSYDWDFGDGNTATVTDPVITRVYGAQGNYNVKLTVTDNDGLSRSIMKSTAIGTPSPPQNLQATAGDSHIDLTWQSPSSEGGSAITNYRVYRGTSSGILAFLVEVGNISAYTDTGLTNGVPYYYQVSAVNAIGEGPRSEEASATPLGVPSSPHSLQAIAGDSKVTLTWQVPSSDGGSAITNYRIYRGTSSGSLPFLIEVGNLLTYTDTGLTNGVTYYYQVSAVNGVGRGPWSNEASATAGLPPYAPLNLQATAGNGQVDLTWAPPADDGGSPITGYRIYRGTASGGETFLVEIGDMTGVTDTGLTNGRTYYYEVSAVNAVGESERSNEACAIPAAPAETTDPISPVKAGDFINYSFEVAGAPPGVSASTLEMEFLSVCGAEATVRLTLHSSDGTEMTDTTIVDLAAGGGGLSGLVGFVIPVGRTTGDSVFISGWGDVAIEGETTRPYAGAGRTVVIASFTQDLTELTYSWDKQTGVMLEQSITSASTTATVRAIETNMWEPDTTTPTVEITSPVDGATLSATSVTVTGTASDDLAVAKVELSTDGTSWVLAADTSSWSGTLTLAEGPNRIYARATDISGHIATVRIAVTVDTTPLGLVSPSVAMFAGIGVAAAVAAVAALLLWRRRAGGKRKAGPPEVGPSRATWVGKMCVLRT